MINADMRSYDFYIYGIDNGYGQPSLSTEPLGSVKMAIHITSQSTQDNINYHGATYVGLTHSLLDDTHVIQYGDKKLKVLYVNPRGRFNQVYMEELA